MTSYQPMRLMTELMEYLLSYIIRWKRVLHARTCKNFLKVGLLCCHVFYVFKDLKLKCIPNKYVVSRWTKNICADIVLNPQIAKLNQAKQLLRMILSRLF